MLEGQPGHLIGDMASIFSEEFIMYGCYRESKGKCISLSLHLLEDNKSLRGEDCNVPNFYGTLNFAIFT